MKNIKVDIKRYIISAVLLAGLVVSGSVCLAAQANNSDPKLLGRAVASMQQIDSHAGTKQAHSVAWQQKMRSALSSTKNKLYAFKDTVGIRPLIAGAVALSAALVAARHALISGKTEKNSKDGKDNLNIELAISDNESAKADSNGHTLDVQGTVKPHMQAVGDTSDVSKNSPAANQGQDSSGNPRKSKALGALNTSEPSDANDNKKKKAGSAIGAKKIENNNTESNVQLGIDNAQNNTEPALVLEGEDNKLGTKNKKNVQSALPNGENGLLDHDVSGEQEQKIDRQDDQGLTELMIACRDGDFEAVTKIFREKLGALGKFPDCSPESRNGFTALYYAAHGSKEDRSAVPYQKIFCLLLHAGADIGKTYSDGWTPWQYARSIGNSFKDSNGNNILQVLDKQNRHNITEFFRVVKAQKSTDEDIERAFSRINIEEYRDDKGNTILHDAAAEGLSKAVDFLIKKGGKELVLALNNDDLTALMFAAWAGHVNVVEAFLHTDGYSGAKPVSGPVIDKNGYTGLMYALVGGNQDTIDLLLKYTADADIDECGKDGMTALMVAASLGNELAVNMLLNRGAKMFAVTKDNNELTPLLYAVGDGRVHIVRFLLERMQNMPMPIDEYKNAYEYVISSGQIEEACEYACQEGHLEVLKILSPLLTNITEEMVNDWCAVAEENAQEGTDIEQLRTGIREIVQAHNSQPEVPAKTQVVRLVVNFDDEGNAEGMLLQRAHGDPADVVFVFDESDSASSWFFNRSQPSSLHAAGDVEEDAVWL